MNNEYLYRAKEKISDAKTLIVLASKRATQLAKGANPMIKCKEDNLLDIALLEIAEGLLEPDFSDKPEEGSLLAEAEALKKKAEAENQPLNPKRKDY